MTEHLPARREDDLLPLLPPAMAAHSPPTTTRPYDHNKDEVTLDEVERIIL